MTGLPPGWTEARLDQVAEVKLGRQRSPKNHQGDRMRPYLRAANVTWDGLDLSDVKEMNFTEEESDVFELQARDILVGEASGSRSEVGKPALWNSEIAGCCFQNTLLRVRARGPLPEYLLYLLRTEALSGRLGNDARGVGIHHIGAARLSSWVIRLAPLPEQSRIVAAIEEQISRLDSAGRSLGRAQARITALRRALFSAVASSGEPGTVGELLADIEAGKSFKCHGHPAPPDEWGVIKVSAMTWGQFDAAENKAVLSKDAIDPRWEIHPGDLLLSRANTTDYVGASVLVGNCRPRLLLSDKSMRLITKPDVNKAWLQAVLSAPETRAQMSAVATGTSDSMRNISQEKVRRLRVRVPEPDVQQSLAARLARGLSVLDSFQASVESAAQRGTALRRSILESAFCGELVDQDPAEESASALLERMAVEPSSRGGSLLHVREAVA